MLLIRLLKTFSLPLPQLPKRLTLSIKLIFSTQSRICSEAQSTSQTRRLVSAPKALSLSSRELQPQLPQHMLLMLLKTMNPAARPWPRRSSKLLQKAHRRLSPATPQRRITRSLTSSGSLLTASRSTALRFPQFSATPFSMISLPARGMVKEQSRITTEMKLLFPPPMPHS